MSLKYAIFSILLLLIVIFLAIKSYETCTQPIGFSPEKGVEKKMETRIEVPPMVPTGKEPPAIESSILIAEKNIFSPERKEFPILTAATAKKPMARPQIILYGVTVMGEYQSATIVDSTRPLKKEAREMLTLMKGEQIGEYKLTKILPDRITLEATEDTFEVLLYDPKVAKKRSTVKTETKPAAITSTLPATTSPGAPKPAPPAIEKPRAAVQERVSAPPPIPQPAPPPTSLPTSRRGRRLFNPPPGASAPTEETGGN